MSRRTMWGLMTVLACLVAVYALMALTVAGMRPPIVVDLLAARAWRTVGHLGAGSVAIVAGALQFNTRIRFESPHVHRLLGRVYVVAVCVGGVAAGLLAPWSDGGLAAHFGFGLLAVLWVGTAIVAWRSAVSGDYSAHRAWMVRSYALCLAAVTLRLYLPVSLAFGVAFESAYPAIAWLCWVPNLILAEWLFVPGTHAPLEPVTRPG